MMRTLLMVWVALLGAVRLDLAGGSLRATLSPFLVLTPLVIGTLALQRFLKARPVVIEWAALSYLLLVAIFFTTVGASTFLSVDADSTLARGALLIMQFGGATAVALLIHDDPEAIAALRAGAMLGVVLFAVMDVLAILSFVGVLPTELPLGPAALRLDSYGYAGIIPRLSGAAIDPNHAGLLLLVYAFLAPRTRTLAIVLLLVTLSRSAALAALTLGVASAWQFGVAHRAAPVRRLLLLFVLLGAGLVAIARSPRTAEGVVLATAPFAERIGMTDVAGSATDHKTLIIRAFDEGSRNMSRALLGLGYGASYVVLQDMFPGHRYGHFHTLYGTAFAEAGIGAFLAVLALLLVPLVRQTQWRPLIAAFVVFNLFYQGNGEPVFWLLLALAWVTKRAGSTPERSLT